MKLLKKNSQSGQSLVEFALVVPLLITLLIAIFYFAFLGVSWFGAYRSAGNAAHEAAIHIMDGTTSCDMRALMGRGNPVFIGVENEVFYMSGNCTDNELDAPTAREEVIATWEFDFQPPLPFVSFSHHFTITASDFFR